MIKKSFINIITSLPIILIALYFLPVLGILLILLKFITATNKNNSIATILIILGLLIQVPNLLKGLSKTFKFTIPYLNKIVEHNLYYDLTKYSTLLIIVGVVMIIITTLFNKLFGSLKNTLNEAVDTYVTKSVEQDREIDKENDLEIKTKQEKAKNTHVVHCPNCGADNIVSEKVTRCKYCRTELESKE